MQPNTTSSVVRGYKKCKYIDYEYKYRKCVLEQYKYQVLYTSACC